MVTQLGASSIGESSIGMAQVQTQLAALMIQLSEITKGKEKHEEIWCRTFTMEGHHKNELRIFRNYLEMRDPNPFPNEGISC